MTDEQLIRYLDIAHQPGAREYIRRLSPRRRELYERIALLHRNLRTGNTYDQHECNCTQHDCGQKELG